MNGPIDVAYVEIRPTPNAKQDFRRDLEQAVDPAADGVSRRISKAVGDGLKTPVGATAAGAAIGTILGRGIGAGAAAALRGVTLLPRTGFAELKDYQAGLAQLEAGLKSTGGVVGRTSGELEDLASAIQKYSGQTDDSIVRSESFLLTFDKIRDSVGAGNDVFTRATKATADLAARLGGDAADKAILLGKALNDPVAGLTGLARAGVQFDDSQKRTIRSLTETGRLLDAQKIVLAEVEKQVGGSAKAYGDTLPGQIDRGKRAFEDISQSVVGATFSFVEHNTKTTAALAGVVGGVYTAHKVVSAYHALQTTLLAGTGKKIAANAALARSYDGVAAAAGRAAAAEGAAAGGAAAGGGGLLARFGIGAGAGAAGLAAGAVGLGAGVVGFAGVHSIGTVKTNQQVERLQKQLEKAGADQRDIAKYDLSLREKLLGFDKDRLRKGQELLKRLQDAKNYTVDTTGLVDPRLAGAAKALAEARGELNDPTRRNAAMAAVAGALGTPFGEQADRTKGDPAAAREAQRKADQAVREAQRAYDRVAAGGRGATAAQIASAEAGVVSAQEAIRKRGGSGPAEQARLEAAEARLAELREKGGVNADRLREAEERLKEARRNAGTAAAETKKAEETTALSVKALTDRLGMQLKSTRGLGDAARELVKDGVSRGVLDELYKLEKDAPGTLERVAKGMSPTVAKSLNSQYGALQKAQQDFLVQPLRAAAEAAKAEQDKILAEAAKRQAEAYQQALRDNLFSDLDPTLPEPRRSGPDPQEHGAPRVPDAVTVQLTGVRASTVHEIARAAIADHDSRTAAMVSPLS